MFGFEDEKGWAMNFGEFIYSFHLPGVLIIGITIYTINKSVNDRNYVLTSFILSNPIWYMPWNIGINDYFGQVFFINLIVYYFLLFSFLFLLKR